QRTDTQWRMQIEQFSKIASIAAGTLRAASDDDWSGPAGPLSWSCRETAGHIVDVVFSYALQLAAEAKAGYVPLNELRPLPEAQPRDIVDAFAAVARMFHAVLASAAAETRAWHSLGLLSPGQWAGLGANEVLMHTFDICDGLHVTFVPAGELCEATLDDMLRLHNRPRESLSAIEPCAALLELSGRETRA